MLLLYFCSVFTDAKTYPDPHLTYWIDTSCQRKPSFQKALDEAFVFAASAVDKLNKINSEPLSVYFENFFGTPTSNKAAVSEVQCMRPIPPNLPTY